MNEKDKLSKEKSLRLVTSSHPSRCNSANGDSYIYLPSAATDEHVVDPPAFWKNRERRFPTQITHYSCVRNICCSRKANHFDFVSSLGSGCCSYTKA